MLVEGIDCPEQHPFAVLEPKVMNPLLEIWKVVYTLSKNLKLNPICNCPETWSSDKLTLVPPLDVSGLNGSDWSMV